jgi:protocatechuate 3,4-dioxygenase beta subunit
VARPQIFLDGFRLGWRFDDDELQAVTFLHAYTRDGGGGRIHASSATDPWYSKALLPKVVLVEASRRTTIAGIAATALFMPGSALAQVRRTPNVILGPFYPLAKPVEQDWDLSLLNGHRALGQRIEVTGRVSDLRGNPIAGARMEIWQANAAGRYDHPADTNPAPLDPNFQGFGRLRTDRLGHFRFRSVMPGPYPTPDGDLRAPHVHLQVQSDRSRLITQMLFPGELLNETDRVTSNVNRARITARDLGPSAGGARRLGWDIVLDLG